FRLDEPWDSPHNIKLLRDMPAIYQPFKKREFPPGYTFYQVIVGPGTLFERPEGLKLPDRREPLSPSFLIVEAAEPVPWTKPEDPTYAPNGPWPQLGGVLRDGHARVAWGDGSVSVVQLDEPENLRAAITGRER